MTSFKTFTEAPDKYAGANQADENIKEDTQEISQLLVKNSKEEW